jgi:DNA helicase HerA-like ATPase
MTQEAPAPLPPAELVTHDFTQDASIPLPATLLPIGKVVHYNGTPNFSGVDVLLNPEIEVKPGQFLAVWHGRRNPNCLTVIQVSNCAEVNPNEEPTLAAARDRLGLNAGYAGEGVSTRIFRLASCETIEEFEVKDISSGDWSVVNLHAPENLARAGDNVVSIPQDLAYETIGGLKDKDLGIHLGQSYGPNPIEVTLPPQVFQMHMGIFGNPGKGKSYSGGILIEEAFLWNIPMLVLDVNGEMADTAKALGGLVITLPDPKNFGLSLNLLTPPELVSITPNVQAGTNYAELIELAHDQLRNEAQGGEVSFAELKRRIEKLGLALENRPASIKTAIGRLSVLEGDPLIGQNFDFISNLQKHKLVVLDCRFLSLRQTQLIAAAAARVLQAYGRRVARDLAEGKIKESDWFAIFFVDEAHSVVPNVSETVSTQVLYELARMGRHVRTGLILSSQSPSDLDSSVLKRLQTRFIFALEPDQLRSISGVVADLNPKILAQLPKLPKGICAVSGSSELVRHGFLLKVKARRTPVGGSTPPIFKNRNKKALGA